jgi:putative restriction endonuclease
MTSKRWSEDETKLALFLYFQLPFGKLHSNTIEIIQLAESIGRTPSSVSMKLCNFASLDPKITGSGRKGLDGASNLDKLIFAKFHNNWSNLVTEAEGLWAVRVDDPLLQSDKLQSDKNQKIIYEFEPYTGPSTAEKNIEYRIGQSFFRRAVLANYEDRCCITGISDMRLLTASHIKPWSVDKENRHNPANGFALSATFDRAFDRGLCTITAEGRVMISTQLLVKSCENTQVYFDKYQHREIYKPIRFELNKAFIDWHRSEVFIP